LYKRMQNFTDESHPFNKPSINIHSVTPTCTKSCLTDSYNIMKT